METTGTYGSDHDSGGYEWQTSDLDIRCQWCCGLLEQDQVNRMMYRDLLGARLCSAAPDNAVERHHRP